MHYCYYTTPIYYVNASPHIGHAYTSILADVLTRFAKLSGRNAILTTGVDEHGDKIAKAAAEFGLSPQSFCDQNTAKFMELAELLNIKYDHFIRTTSNNHIKAAQHVWQTLVDKNLIYKGSYSGWYSIKDETFFNESELIDGLAPTGATVEWLEEECYFFKLSQYKDALLEHYAEHDRFIMMPNRKTEIIKMLHDGLSDLAVSRSRVSWGIPVPGDDKHVMYVWFEALINYLTAIGYPDNISEKSMQYWAHCTHVIGKEILRFHVICWPAMLMALGYKWPQQVLAHGWITVNGHKMSKSDNNVINPFVLCEKYSVDMLRYFMMRNSNLSEDGNFVEESMVERWNGELANNIGNLFSRVLGIVHNKCDGAVVPYIDREHDVFIATDQLITKVTSLMHEASISKAIEEVLSLSRLCNKQIDILQPWNLIDQHEIAHALYPILYAMRAIAVILQAFIPTSAEILLEQLRVHPHRKLFNSLLQPYVPEGAIGMPVIAFQKF